jgi:hypothetical protein
MGVLEELEAHILSYFAICLEQLRGLILLSFQLGQVSQIEIGYECSFSFFRGC